MRRLNFLQDDPWDEVNDEISRVSWFGHPRVPRAATKESSLASSWHRTSSASESLRQVEERVVDLEWPAAHHDRPGNAHGIDSRVGVPELRVETARRDVSVPTHA
jgi:hypothetical protein